MVWHLFMMRQVTIPPRYGVFLESSTRAMLKFLFGNYAYTQLQLDLMLAGVAIVGIAGVYWLRAAEAMYPFLPLKHRLLLVGILEALAGVVILSGIYLLTD